MNKYGHTDWLLAVCIFIMIVTACSPTLPMGTPTPSSPTQSPPSENTIPTAQIQRGWFVARILAKDAESKSPEEILRILVIQLLEHYKTQNESPTAAIKDYAFDGIGAILGVSHDPFNGIVASVKFSIIPVQTPNDWASLPVTIIGEDDTWWRLSGLFNAFREGEYFKLRMLNSSYYLDI